MKKLNPQKPAPQIVRSKTVVKNVVVISDTHFGCQFGLCPACGTSLDGGGHYNPSRLQRVVWSWWREFWDKWIPSQIGNEPFDLVHNGDVIDGVHHNSTTQISHSMQDQRILAMTVLVPEVAKASRYFSIRGTPAHVGESSVEEETVARNLNAVKSVDGQYSRNELWLEMGRHLVHFMHHVGTTSSAAHESSAVNAELAAEFTEAARWGERAPSAIIRSHRHRCIEIRLPGADGFITTAVTPAWQLKTPFVFKVAGGRIAPPQIGGMLIRTDRSGCLYTTAFCKHIARDAAE